MYFKIWNYLKSKTQTQTFYWGKNHIKLEACFFPFIFRGVNMQSTPRERPPVSVTSLLWNCFLDSIWTDRISVPVSSASLWHLTSTLCNVGLAYFPPSHVITEKKLLSNSKEEWHRNKQLCSLSPSTHSLSHSLLPIGGVVCLMGEGRSIWNPQDLV